jgi:outer membrane biosynthesis protein TonB
MDASIRSRSLTLTLLIHLGIFLLLLFFVMKTPIPPFAEAGGGGGVIVNIGYLESASGDVQPMSEQTTVDPAVNKVKPVAQQEEKIATQEFEESPVTKVKKEESKTKVKTEPKTAQVEKKVTEPVKTVNTSALYKGKTTSSTSQGTAATGTGDQGSKDGDPLSKYYGKNGSGGPGTGTGTGEGPGSGPGKGGISFDLSGRKMTLSPVVDDRSQETGKVVVAITVDKTGTVIAAIPGYRGSTTTSTYLFSKAKDAAMKARFNPSADGADIQKGTITFVFVVQ